MTIRTWMAVAALFAATTCCAGEPRQLSLRWSELGERAGGSKVAVVLPDATRIEGRVMQVEPEGLRLKVSKTSDRKTHPKGPSLIPRASITFLRVIEYRHIGRVVCAAGAVAAVAGITLAASGGVYEGPLVVIVPAASAGGAVGLGVAGYYIGKALDRKVTEIRIVQGD